MCAGRIDMSRLGRVALPFLWYGPGLERLGLLVEARDATLIHHADPEIAGLVGLEIQRADRITRLEHGQGVFPDLAGLRVHLAEELLGEVGEPDYALLIDDDVMRLDQPARQVVFRDDDAVGAAGEPRQCLELIGPGLLAQIDGGEIFRRYLHAGPLAERAARVADEPLRMLRRAARVVTDHPVEDADELLGVVLRAYDAVQVMAAHAIEQRLLLLIRAGEAYEPFGVGHLLGQIFRRCERDLDACRLPGQDPGGLGAFEVIADGAGAE